MYIPEYEQKFIQKLISNGISEENATVAIHIFFERYKNPIDDLPAILCIIAPALLNNEKINASIDWMISHNLATKIHKDSINKQILRVNDSFPNIIEKEFNIQGISEELKKEYNGKIQRVNINPLGIVGQGEENYSHLLTRLKLARRTIKYSILTTEPYDSIATVLESVAQKGVLVKILIANDAIAMKYKQKHTVYKRWKKRFKGIKNIQIKVFGEECYTELCTSVLIDDEKLQLVVYDPKTTRSLNGYLLELVNKPNEELNLIKWFNEKFNVGWCTAYRNTFSRTLSKIFSFFTLSIIILVFSIFLFQKYSNNAIIGELVLLAIGSSATYILQKSFDFITKVIKRFISFCKTQEK